MEKFKIFRAKALLIIAASAVVVLLTACGGGGSAVPEVPQKTIASVSLSPDGGTVTPSTPVVVSVVNGTGGGTATVTCDGTVQATATVQATGATIAAPAQGWTAGTCTGSATVSGVSASTAFTVKATSTPLSYTDRVLALGTVRAGYGIAMVLADPATLTKTLMVNNTSFTLGMDPLRMFAVYATKDNTSAIPQFVAAVSADKWVLVNGLARHEVVNGVETPTRHDFAVNPVTGDIVPYSGPIPASAVLVSVADTNMAISIPAPALRFQGGSAGGTTGTCFMQHVSGLGLWCTKNNFVTIFQVDDQDTRLVVLIKGTK